jgi:hypothetical protein
MDLQQRQRDQLTRVLTDVHAAVDASSSALDPFGGGGGSGSSGVDHSTAWKVLVYDAYGRDVLATLFSVGELKRLGVTLHLMLHSPREPVHDVPALYFCRPTAENLSRIAADLQNALYDDVQLHFTSLQEPFLRALAARAAAAGAADLVSRVCNQWTEFVSLDSRLISLNHAHSYAAAFAPRLSDRAREAYLLRAVTAVVSVVATAGALPVIRCPAEEGPARAVATQVAAELRARPTLVDGDASSSSSAAAAAAAAAAAGVGIGAPGSGPRPLLVVLDRQCDMTGALHHAWTYLALISDLLGYRANRVPIPPEHRRPASTPTAKAGAAPTAAAEVTDWEIDTRDPFWVANYAEPISSVAEAVDAAVSRYKAESEEVMSRTAQQQQQSGSADMSAASAALAGAIASLPQLTRRKAQLDMHTTLGLTLVALIRARSLDAFHEIEETTIAGAPAAAAAGAGAGDRTDKPALGQLVRGGKGTVLDRLRAVLIAYFAAEQPETAYYAEVFAALEKQAQAADSAAGVGASAGAGVVAGTAAGASGGKPSASAGASARNESVEDDFAAALMGPSKPAAAAVPAADHSADPEAGSGPGSSASAGAGAKRLGPQVSAAIRYAKAVKGTQMTMQALRASNAAGGGATGGGAGGASTGGKSLFDFARSVIDQSAQAFSSLHSGEHNVQLPVTRLVHSLMLNAGAAAGSRAGTATGAAGAAAGAGASGGGSGDASADAAARRFLYFDPRVAQTQQDGQAPAEARARQPFRNVIVVMLGGGSCAEYINLQELAARVDERAGPVAASIGAGGRTSIAYAASEVLSPEDFVAAMADLGAEHSAAVGALERIATEEDV